MSLKQSPVTVDTKGMHTHATEVSYFSRLKRQIFATPGKNSEFLKKKALKNHINDSLFWNLPGVHFDGFERSQTSACCW